MPKLRCECGVCKTCRNREYNRRYREKHPERRKESQRRYDEKNKDKAHAYYLANQELIKARAKKWKQDNPERRRQNNRRWREANPEKARESVRKFAKANPEKICDKVNLRRARKAHAPTVENFTRAEIFERDCGRCRYCERRVDPTKWHMAHLVALANGGSHARANVAVSCPECNLRDGTGRMAVQMHLAA